MMFRYVFLSLAIILLGSCAKDSTSNCTLEKNLAQLSSDSYVVLRSRNHGMFSILDDVLSLLHAYEEGRIKGVSVDFADTGLYYDRKKGPNWFSYYFEPVMVGVGGDRTEVTCVPYENDVRVKKMGLYAIEHIEFGHVSRTEAHRLIAKYLKLRPEIEREVSSFVDANFKNNYIISIHYRGTDKISEGKRTPYEQVDQAVAQVVRDEHLSRYKVFVATDEQGFIEHAEKKFRDVCFQEAIRSTGGKPIHFNSEDPSRAGKEALVDSLLLSKANFLIRTSSNLSRWSTYFNPDLKVLELSTRW